MMLLLMCGLAKMVRSVFGVPYNEDFSQKLDYKKKDSILEILRCAANASSTHTHSVKPRMHACGRSRAVIVSSSEQVGVALLGHHTQ